MNMHRILMRQARKSGLALFFNILTSLISTGTVIYQAWQLALIIHNIFLDKVPIQTLTQNIIILGGMILVRGICSVLIEVTGKQVSTKVKSHLRAEILKKLSRLGPIYASNEKRGEIIHTLFEGVEALDAYFSQLIPQVFLAVLIPVAILVSVFPLEPLSGGILLVTAPLIPLFMALIGIVSEQKTKTQWGLLTRLSTYFYDALQGLELYKQYNQVEQITRQVESTDHEYRTMTLQVLRFTFLSALVLELVATLSTAIIAVEIGIRLLYGHLEYLPALFVLILTPEYYLPLRQLSIRYHAAMSGIQAAGRIFSVLDLPESSQVPHQHNNGYPSPSSTNSIFPIEFDHVGACYPGQSSEVVSNLNFRIEAGSHLALVGQSGAGKTTIFNLLLRFLTPSSGQIISNGRPLESIPKEDWLMKIAWIPQSPMIFQGTILQNILLREEQPEEERLIQAIDAAGLANWINTLPQKWNTPTGERGLTISSGQAQRIAIARAFYKSAELVLLDEPTSAVDPMLEADLEQLSQKVLEKKTTLTIAHRLPTIYRSDQILLVDQGTICETGTHTELLKSNGLYAQFVNRYVHVSQ